MSDDNADNDSDDNGDTERPQVDFEHIQRVASGERFIRINTVDTMIFVQIYHEHIDELIEQLEESPTVV